MTSKLAKVIEIGWYPAKGHSSPSSVQRSTSIEQTIAMRARLADYSRVVSGAAGLGPTNRGHRPIAASSPPHGGTG